MTGGNFWQGAATGLTVSLLNHVAHSDDQNPPKTKKAPIQSRPDKDGHLTLDEANEWYRTGKGQTLTVDASKVDLNFVDTSKWEAGKTYGVQTLTKSKDGRVYGNIRVKYLGNNKVSIYPDKYDFDQHGSFFSSTFRNTANAIGRAYAGDGIPYKINFSGVNTINYNPPPATTYSQTSHGFRF